MKVSVKPETVFHLVDDGLGLLVLPELQIGIDHVVHAVQLIVERLVQLRDTRGFGVGRDRLLPVADAREDVRGHVLGMRRGWRDLGIASRGIEALLGDRRIVVEVNEIVRDAGMLRLALGDRLEDCRALELVGVGLVGRRGRCVERERVMDLRLVVLRILLCQLLHRLGIGHDARAVIELLVVGVHDRERVDIVALALRLGADALALRNGGGAVGEILRRRRHVRVPEQAQRNAPIGDAAFGIGLQHILKRLLRCAVPERMLVQHRAIEKLLRLRLAGGLETDVSKLLAVLREHGLRNQKPRHGDGSGQNTRGHVRLRFIARLATLARLRDLTKFTAPAGRRKAAWSMAGRSGQKCGYGR